MKELGSEVAQRPDGQVVQQSKNFQSSQPNPNPDHDRTGKPVVRPQRGAPRSQEIETRSFREETVKHDRTVKPVVCRDENHAKGNEQSMLNEVDIDFRILGLPHSVVKQADNSRVRELVKKIDNHPHRQSLQRDLQQNNAYNPFSETSKKMIQDVGNVELFELFETDPKTQCKACLSYWSEGMVRGMGLPRHAKNRRRRTRDDGAIEFWRIKDDLQNHFLYCHQSDEKCKKSMARGGGNKKRFQYCTDLSRQEFLDLRALQGHSGRNPIDPSLQDYVLIPDDFFEYIYHVGCAFTKHSIIHSGLILGGQNLSNRQTVFFLPVDPMDKDHKDLKAIDLEAPRLAQYMHKAWKKHQNTVYWVDVKLAQRKD